MNTTQTTMLITQPWLFIQSRTLGISTCARLRNSRKKINGEAAISVVVAISGSAPVKDRPLPPGELRWSA
jgi:hypothetical protein